VRRAVLEVTRAVSLTPWAGDVTFNAASPGATPSAQKKGSNPVPYGTEMHATRYQYGMALTPSALRVPARAATALRALCALGPVAGNHGRFLFDFSPESAVFRVTHEAAPRILYAFQAEEGSRVSLKELLRKVRGGDIPAKELVLGGAVVEELSPEEREALSGAELHAGVLAACEAVCKRLEVDAK
jgi:CRISPR-associated protein Cst2